MTTRRSSFIYWLALFHALQITVMLPVHLHAQQAPTIGPTKGWLLLEGGGKLGGTEIVTRFVALAGGSRRNLVVIPTAVSDTQLTPEQLERFRIRSAEIFGVEQVTVLDAKDRNEADSEKFVAALDRADGVWFYGGDEWRLVERFVGTRTERALRALLERGGVIGGTSAGAMLQAAYIPNRDPSRVSGFGFLQGTTIAPHFTQRHYENDLTKLLAVHPGLRGMGIDESTAIVVHGNEFEVIGEGAVIVYGHHQATVGRGQKFDLQTETFIGTRQ